MPRVPVANLAGNRLAHEVVGNKSDLTASAVNTSNSLVSYAKGILATTQGLVGGIVEGETGIDISEEDYTDYVDILVIAPESGEVLADLVIDIDIDKETTGWDTVSTGSDTLDIAVFAKIDGDNERIIAAATQLTATGSGGHATGAVRINVGPVGQSVNVKAKLNAERDDVDLPFAITYRGSAPAVATFEVPEAE